MSQFYGIIYKNFIRDSNKVQGSISKLNQELAS